MPELIAKSALDGRSLTLAGVTLAEASAGPITSIAILQGGAKDVAKGLKPLGLAFPKPQQFTEKAGVRIVWTGRDQAFLIGVAPPELEGAAVTDQSDGWTVLAVTGVAAVDVLARLVPMDLRPAAFPVKQVLRTQVSHMNAIILRTGDYAVEIMVFRSMARTAWHEVQTAMEMVAARSGIKI
ncbi:COG4583 Sarcosine oxidase gamma subunit [Paracoccaceae bacterium]